MENIHNNNYQEIKKFVIGENLNLEGNSLLCEAMSNNFEILQFIDYWLRRDKEIKGGDNLTKNLKEFGLKDSNNFVGDEQKNWYQHISELESFYFLSNNLGLDIIGYEQPRINNKKPDFEIKLGNESVYFEVKFKSSEVTQRIPSGFDDFLDKIEGTRGNKYRITLVEVTNSGDNKKRPNCQKLFSNYLLLSENKNIVEKKIKEHLDVLDRNKILERKGRDSSTCNVSINAGTEAIDIQFSITLKQANSGERLHGFRPDEIDDIKRWLFEEKDGKTPMVKEAESKGADYLVCFFPFWSNLDETFADYIKPLFSEMQLIDTTHAVSKDRNMGQLSGIILLSQMGSLSNNYIFVANARSIGQQDKNILTHKYHPAIFFPMKKQIPTAVTKLFKYVKIVIIILFILITGYPNNAAAQGQILDIGEGHSIISQKPDGIYIPLNTVFTDVKRAGLKMPSPDHRIIHSYDGRIVASALKAEPEYITLWNTVTGTSLDIHPSELIKTWGLFPDGKILATGGDKNITLWDTATGSVLKVLKGVILSDPFSFSPDGKILATVNNKKVVLRNVDTDNIIKELKGIRASIRSLFFSVDGRMLAILEWDTKNWDRSVTLWDTATWKKIEFKNIYDVVSSPGGRFFGITKWIGGNNSYFYNAKTWSKVATITARDVSFSPDGKILAATDGDSVTLWDTVTWHRLRTFAANNCEVIISSIAFSK